MYKNIIPILSLCCYFLSCKKDKPDGHNTQLPTDSTRKVAIVCEGSLGNGNASLSLYSVLKDSIFNDVYQNANGRALGDIFQSISKINNQYFLCINNSDKIVVLAPDTWLQMGSISVPKPRYLCKVNDQKAYVGSLFSNKMYVINTGNLSVESEIKLPYENAEGILVQGDFAYVCCWDTACSKLYQINIHNDQIEDSIALAGSAPHTLCLDKNNNLWVLGGNVPKNKNSSFSKINLSTKKIKESFVLDNNVDAIKMTLNSTKDTMYYIEVDYNGGITQNGIFRFATESTSISDQAFISCQANQYFWALGIDPNSSKIYVGDPKGFVQKSTVNIYNPQAQLQSQFNVGLGVSSFYFE